ncbi:type IVB secretion system protein IcmH/DotU [Halomonas sp. 328]|uniref:type IVB secretion system protein IcmH/DotU n=1 Tax=Halomonas sp. 328 TaxID=2776704 RepID=UPI0018A7856B|nr:type IVB secretion system protein IcmH/DotU [Halomonas sp. 328]MBF8224198.1 DotU family type IV/VI secretion system protein [Halomonas sp. 328]
MNDLVNHEESRRHDEGRLRHEDGIDVTRVEHLLHGHAGQWEADETFWFHLRGHSLNPLVDAASGLLGMVIRVRRLERHEDVGGLYRQVVDEISSIEIELTDQGYDRPTLLAYRYVLCSFIDEAVMSTEWGRQSVWAEHSLLVRFHNETWGGEKVFSILARLRQEPSRYRDILAFIYLCLCLGFEGRYRVVSQGREDFERLLRDLGEQLARIDEDDGTPFSRSLDNVIQVPRQRKPGMSRWQRLALFGGVMVMAVVYVVLVLSLDEQVTEVARLLERFVDQEQP